MDIRHQKIRKVFYSGRIYYNQHNIFLNDKNLIEYKK